MSAPSMKKRSRRNMMSIMGIRLGATSSWILVERRLAMGPPLPRSNWPGCGCSRALFRALKLELLPDPLQLGDQPGIPRTDPQRLLIVKESPIEVSLGEGNLRLPGEAVRLAFGKARSP